MSKIKTALIALVVGLLIGGSLAYLKPANVKEVVKFKEKTRTVTKVVERPDGTKETTIVKDSEIQHESKRTQSGLPDWTVLASTSLNNPGTPVYTLSVYRRILGTLAVGAYARSDRELGVGVSYSF